MAQYIETQLMPNESAGKDLQIMCGHFYVRSLLHGVICITSVNVRQTVSFILLSFPGHFLVNDLFTVSNLPTCNKISMKLYIYSWVVSKLQCKISLTSRMTLTFQGHNYVKSHFGPYLGSCWTNRHQILTLGSLGRGFSIS